MEYQIEQHVKKAQEVGHHVMLESQVLEIVSGGISGHRGGALKSRQWHLGFYLVVIGSQLRVLDWRQMWSFLDFFQTRRYKEGKIC